MPNQNLFDLARKIPVQEAARRAGLPMRMRGARGWAKCPMHGEKTASLCLYEGDRGFYCFGCHEGGDAIRLYERIFHLSPKEAVLRLAGDFGLEGDFSPQREAAQYGANRSCYKGNPSGTAYAAPPPFAQGRPDARSKHIAKMNSAVCGVLHKAQEELSHFTPETMDDPAFTRALSALAAAQHSLNLKEIENT